MQEINKKFKELTGRRLRNMSPLHQFNILEDEKGDFLFNIWKNYESIDEIKNNEDLITYYTVSEGDWWDSIAYKVYENENLWWIIALTNDVINPFEELDAGEKIKIIRSDFIHKIIKEVRNISEL